MKTFADMGIMGEILQGLVSLGFQEPTPVQEKVIPLMLENKGDLVSLAQTGTGKTAAFGIPLIQLTDRKKRSTQGLVLCPTRELCMQVAADLEAFARYVKDVRVHAVYGGASIEGQIRALRKGVHIIVATPGRLNDLIRRGNVDISAVRLVVFDEADEMLQMGFQEELNSILAKTPADKNTMLFSATMGREVTAIAKRYMKNPAEITVGRRNAGAEHVRHEYYMVQSRHRYDALRRIVDSCPGIYGLIFCRTRQETQDVAAKLMRDGYNADALHGDLSQAQRDLVMGKFRSRNLQLLVATDVAARGLDVNDLTHVINYNLPDDISAYTHRSGRTGRAGSSGTSVAIVHMREQFRIRAIEKRINKKFTQCKVPTGEDICRRQLLGLAETIIAADVDPQGMGPVFDEIVEKFVHLDRRELISRFLSRDFNRFLDYYRNAPDLNQAGRGKDQYDKGEGRQTGPAAKAKSGAGFTRFSLNAGRRQGIMPQGIIGSINNLPGVGRIKIGRIEILRNSSFLEAESRHASRLLDAMQDVIINESTVSISLAPQNRKPARAGKGGPRPGKNKRFSKNPGASFRPRSKKPDRLR